jgi:hypothetical protein
MSVRPIFVPLLVAHKLMALTLMNDKQRSEDSNT